MQGLCCLVNCDDLRKSVTGAGADFALPRVEARDGLHMVFRESFGKVIAFEEEDVGVVEGERQRGIGLPVSDILGEEGFWREPVRAGSRFGVGSAKEKIDPAGEGFFVDRGIEGNVENGALLRRELDDEQDRQNRGGANPEGEAYHEGPSRMGEGRG